MLTCQHDLLAHQLQISGQGARHNLTKCLSAHSKCLLYDAKIDKIVYYNKHFGIFLRFSNVSNGTDTIEAIAYK
jgi:hypothetical protein